MKQRSHLSYLALACVIVVLALLINVLFFNPQTQSPVNKTTEAAPKETENPFTAKNTLFSSTVLEKPNDLEIDDDHEIVDEEVIDEKIIDTAPVEAYKVILKYPTQHVFDDSLCNLDLIQQNFKPQVEKAIKRLGSRYTHEPFVLGEYLELNLYSEGVSTYFKEELTARVQLLHKNYIDMLGISAQKKITINLVVLAKRSHYLHHIAYFSEELSSSIGVYFGGLNLAFVDYQGADDKALKTAVHESVHVLNAHIIGRTPYMFNEGMAEFYENISIKEGKTHFNESEHKITRQSYPVGLFFDNEQWQYLNTGQLYYSSWLWMSFMHTNNEGLGALIYFMQKEQENPCSYLSPDESYSLFQEAYNVFETDFNDAQQNLPPYEE